ncbi:gamma-interferon-inducible lysosomal thiol reductase-like isoform X2 [Convolutriloba macropyga]|uniref:gamma-interferon-inducible lysosomal thiol reductase-like isoform X2 n=1 Tax=Convolutriloba macropyga TaxID=536237 RepID=UPI003F51CDBF
MYCSSKSLVNLVKLCCDSRCHNMSEQNIISGVTVRHAIPTYCSSTNSLISKQTSAISKSNLGRTLFIVIMVLTVATLFLVAFHILGVRSFDLLMQDLSAADSNWTCSTYIKLTVFFEAGCPDSNHFFSYVLTPQYQQFSPVLGLDLIPWGNAQSFSVGDDETAFVSQHGLQEACGYSLLHSSSYVELATCMMSTRGKIQATYDSWEYCAKGYNLDYNRLYNCYKGDRGVSALLSMEKLAKDNQHTFIPWLEINGNSNSTVQSMGLQTDGFVELLCDELCEQVRPAICAK